MIHSVRASDSRGPAEGWFRCSALLLTAVALASCSSQSAPERVDGDGIVEPGGSSAPTVAAAPDGREAPGVARCPEDDAKTEPGVCGCGVPESTADIDGDGVFDCVDDDTCPGDDSKTAPGVCGCGVPEGTEDVDGDGVVECVTRQLFLAAVPNGNLGGAAGADAVCNASPSRPSSATGAFKAMIGNNERAPCVPGTPDCNWVFEPGVRYVRAYDGANVAVANASALLPFPLLNSFHPTWAGEIYSGFSIENGSWTVADNCFEWRFGQSSQVGLVGIALRTSEKAVNEYPQFCSSAATILCVEQ